MEKLKVLELFAGYGSQALALENLGIDFTSDISEIDKYAIQAYNQLHGETHNWGDITKINETKLPYYDLVTYSFPCQDISLAGLQRGLDNGTGTRSSLLWECERIIRAVKPKYLLMENVKNLVGEKHKHNFIRWLRVLEMMGYQNFWQVLNAKDYGVPQNRERVFVVSILGGGQYLFPNPIKLEKRLKDILETDVDKKYYLSDKIIDTFIRRNTINSEKGNGFKFEPTDGEKYAKAITTRAGGRADDNFIQEPIALDEQNKCLRTDGTVGTLTTDGSSPKHNNRVIEPKVIGGIGEINFGKQYRQGNRIYSRDYISPTLQANNGHASGGSVLVNEPTVKQIGNIVQTDSFGGNPERGRVYDDKGISPCLSTMQGGGLEPKIIECSTNARHQQDLIQHQDGICRTIPAGTHASTPHLLKTVVSDYRIRKLTPRECWRLMGVRDEQFDKLHDLSNTQLYKLAGNSIVVDVLMGIFRNMFLENDTTGQLTLF